MCRLQAQFNQPLDDLARLTTSNLSDLDTWRKKANVIAAKAGGLEMIARAEKIYADRELAKSHANEEEEEERLSQALHCLDLLGEAIRMLLAIGIVVDAGLGGDGEARRHRQAQRRHLRQIRPLAAQAVLHRGVTIRAAAAEAVNPLSHDRGRSQRSPSLRWGRLGWDVAAGLSETSRSAPSRGDPLSGLQTFARR